MDDSELEVGNLALRCGLITPDQLKAALHEQAEGSLAGTPRPLGDILVSRGYVTEADLKGLASQPKVDPRLLVPPKGELPVLPEPIASKYTLVRELGRGGMGVVYEARDKALDRRVALKMMLVDRSAFGEWDSLGPGSGLEQERFLRECRLSANLSKHPNIVGVYEAGIAQGKPFLAMEYIEGQPLSEVQKNDSLTHLEQLAILRDVARAVHHAHEHGLIHRDLKPSNVMVDGAKQPHVTDFGLAKRTTRESRSLTGSETVVGTPGYISPEQAQSSKTVDRRTDVFSLGVMLYEILTGVLPFTGESAVQILVQVVTSPVPRPSSIKPEVDPILEKICLKALLKEREDRYPTASALAEDLDQWLGGREVRVRLPWSRSTKTVLFSSAAAVALVLAAAFVSRWAAPVRPGLSPVDSPSAVAKVPETPEGRDRAALSAEPMLPLPTDEIRKDTSFPAKLYALTGVLEVADDAPEVTISFEAGAEVRGGTIKLGRAGQLVLKGTPDRPVIFRGVAVHQDLGASMEARNSVLDSCTFRKAYTRFTYYSSHWTLSSCLLWKCIIPKLSGVDYGIRFSRSAFVGMKFPGLIHDHLKARRESFDHMDYLRTEWNEIKECAFVDSDVPPSIVWCSENSNFFDCRFPPAVAYDSSIPLVVSAYVSGQSPEEAWAANPPSRASIRCQWAAKPFPSGTWGAQKSCPIPELRYEGRYAPLFEPKGR